MLHDQIRNSHIIKYKKNYITLEDIHQDYVTNSLFTPYNFPSVNEFVNKIGPYWTQVLDQVIPSTTLWTGGNLIQNGIFGRPKFSYKFGCEPYEIIENLYPEAITGGYQPFQDEIEELDQYFNDTYGYGFSNEVDELGESEHDGYVKLLPTFTLDGIYYSGSSENSSTYVLVSGDTNTTTSARLYTQTNPQYYTGQTINNTLNPDYNKIKQLWKDAITGTIEYINTYSGVTINQLGKDNQYGQYINYAGITGSTTSRKLLSVSFFTDNDGIEKVKFTSYKYGPNDCTIKKNFNCSLVEYWLPIVVVILL
jgi:hypothetical protein